ncbi:MAG: dihydroorotase [Candidatus Diapherotrites archaeon]|nr:dihydroorotase [Candidatus Diapherotrites archaeon]
MRIDPHVHCRDGAQNYKETIKHVFEIADKQGVDKIFDMPNTNPPIIDEADVLKRLELVPEERKEDYYLYIGATPNKDQLGHAVELYNKYDEIIGIKMFAGKSVGDLEIVLEEDQRKVYQTLAEAGYKGVLAVHCEKESEMKPDKWDPKFPVSHSIARPVDAEIKSVQDQILFAKEADFKGNLHVVHASTPKTVDLVDEARKDMHITCAVTPHHLRYSTGDLAAGFKGLILKVNPPLRPLELVEELRERVKDGKVDWIESDHAPHPVGEKLFPPYMSGIPSLYFYKSVVDDFLPNELEMDGELIKKMTCDNIVKTFGIRKS